MNRKWALILVASLFADEDDMLRCLYCRESVMECLLAALDQSYSIQLNYLCMVAIASFSFFVVVLSRESSKINDVRHFVVIDACHSQKWDSICYPCCIESERSG